MTLRIFLDYICRIKKLPQGTVFCFSGREYPLLFFYHLILFLKKNDLMFEFLDCATVEIVGIKTLLATESFFGQTVYVLEHFYTLSAKKQQELLEYVREYKGPHQVILFSTTIPQNFVGSDNDHMLVISLDDHVGQQELMYIRCLVGDFTQEKTNFTAQIAMYSDYLTMDNICLFAHYEIVLGKNVEDFFAQWITRIIDPTSSFFVLSQHFFSKKSKPFFRQWSTVSEQYMPPFWTSFWSDQVWRAYIFCDLMQQKQYAHAKKAQYKLPFSFINRDWSSYSLDELRNAHQFLCTLDFRLKNGSSEIGLEHFYGTFFGNHLQ